MTRAFHYVAKPAEGESTATTAVSVNGAKPVNIVWRDKREWTCTNVECFKYPVLRIQQERQGYHTHHESPDVLCVSVENLSEHPSLSSEGLVREIDDDELQRLGGCGFCDDRKREQL